MTRVLMTADTLGGVWTYAIELSDELAQRGHEVHLATMGAEPRPDQRTEATAAGARLHASRYALEWMDEPWADVDAAGAWLVDLEHSLRPDIVHLNGYVHATLGWRAPTVVVGHSDVLSWWEAVHRQPAPSRWATYRARVADGLRAADAVVAPSAALAADLRRLYVERHIEVIHNGRSSGWLPAGDKQALVLGTGRAWDAAKNLSLVHAVSSRLRWPVLVVGEGSSVGRLAFPDVARHLAAASIFVAPARYEPFGLGILEAAIAGCALVLGDIPSLREVWADAAVYVDPDDERALALELDRLTHDDAGRAALGRRARARAARYAPGAMADRYAALYDRLLARRAAVGGAA